MLILVGVTITVALNGGLFNTAQSAATNTMVEAEREQLLSAVVTAYDTETGTISKAKLEANLGTGWNVEGDTAPYTVTSPKGNKFTVAADGTISTDGTIGSNDVTLPEGLTVGSEFEMDANKDGTNETWIVLYDGTADHLNENEIEVISKNTMGEKVTLGADDPMATANATDLDGDGNITDIDKAIYSFEHCVDTLNSYCTSLIKIKNLGVRSVGTNPDNSKYVNTEHTADSVVTNLSGWTDAGKQALDKYKMLAGAEDNNYEKDWNKMQSLNIRKADENYWLGSRDLSEFWSNVNTTHKGALNFNVWTTILGDSLYGYSVWKIDSEGDLDVTSAVTYAVRPVVKLQYP